MGLGLGLGVVGLQPHDVEQQVEDLRAERHVGQTEGVRAWVGLRLRLGLGWLGLGLGLGLPYPNPNPNPKPEPPPA